MTCLRPSVFQRSVWRAEPWSNGLMPRATQSGFRWTTRSSPSSAAVRSRKSYIAENFHVVSTWTRGNGGFDGWNAFIAKWSMTELSLPIE